jgi:hypothetical protein
LVFLAGLATALRRHSPRLSSVYLGFVSMGANIERAFVGRSDVALSLPFCPDLFRAPIAQHSNRRMGVKPSVLSRGSCTQDAQHLKTIRQLIRRAMGAWNKSGQNGIGEADFAAILSPMGLVARAERSVAAAPERRQALMLWIARSLGQAQGKLSFGTPSCSIERI